jgi:hypothetical protein
MFYPRSHRASQLDTTSSNAPASHCFGQTSYGGTSVEWKQPYFQHNGQFSKLEELLIFRWTKGGDTISADTYQVFSI